MRTEKRDRIESFRHLDRLFSYNPSTGQLFWKVLFPGREAGTKLANGSGIKVALEGLDFKAHRLCWILYYKRKPKKGMVLDHINGDPTDNCIRNLRQCTQRENSRNSNTPKNSTTGFKGVSKQGTRFRAYITVDRKQINLGRHDTAEGAYEAYVIAAQKHFGRYFSYG